MFNMAFLPENIVKVLFYWYNYIINKITGECTMKDYDEIEKVHKRIKEKIKYINEVFVPNMNEEELEVHQDMCECFDMLVMLKEKNENM